MKSKEVALIGLMLSLSLLLQVMPLKVKTPWGMDIDLVAVPIIVVTLLLGFTSSLIALGLLFIGISLISSTSWLGASMKVPATLSVVIGVEVARRITRFSLHEYTPKSLALFLLLAYAIGTAIRIPLMVALNYYYALPLYLNIPREQVIHEVEKWFHMPFWLVIGIPNAIQSAVDIIGGLLLLIPVLRRFPQAFD